MSSEKIEVSRELLEVYTGRKEGDWVEAGHELRALLDAPAKPVESVNTQLREALEGMVEYFPEGHSDGECFSVERAREVLAVAATRPALASGGGTTS